MFEYLSSDKCESRIHTVRIHALTVMHRKQMFKFLIHLQNTYVSVLSDI